jgi:hypothetical protein
VRSDCCPIYPWGYMISESAARKEAIRMCSPAVCSECSKITYTGCGMHVDQVLAMFTEDERCKCEKRSRRGLFSW